MQRDAAADASAAAEAERQAAREAQAEKAEQRATVRAYAADLGLVVQGLEEPVSEAAAIGGLQARRAVSQLDSITPPRQYASKHEFIRDKLEEATYFSGIERGVRVGVATNALRKLMQQASSGF